MKKKLNLNQIKPHLTAFVTVAQNRKEEVILNCLRLGHTNATHGYLMDNSSPTIPPICHFCNDSTLTVSHIFTQCTALGTIRQISFPSQSLEAILGTRADSQNIFPWEQYVMQANRCSSRQEPQDGAILQLCRTMVTNKTRHA